jgi:hypothetical protein
MTGGNKLVSFEAIKVAKEPARVSFHTDDGKKVNFVSKKYIPRSVRVTFFAKKSK